MEGLHDDHLERSHYHEFLLVYFGFFFDYTLSACFVNDKESFILLDRVSPALSAGFLCRQESITELGTVQYVLYLCSRVRLSYFLWQRMCGIMGLK